MYKVLLTKTYLALYNGIQKCENENASINCSTIIQCFYFEIFNQYNNLCKLNNKKKKLKCQEHLAIDTKLQINYKLSLPPFSLKSLFPQKY